MEEERKTVYVCLACGKRSKDQFGYSAIDKGWDESCLLNSVEAYEDALTIENGRVTRIAKNGLVNVSGMGMVKL